MSLRGAAVEYMKLKGLNFYNQWLQDNNDEIKKLRQELIDDSSNYSFATNRYAVLNEFAIGDLILKTLTDEEVNAISLLARKQHNRTQRNIYIIFAVIFFTLIFLIRSCMG